MIFRALQMHIKKDHDGTEVNYKIFQLMKGWKKIQRKGGCEARETVRSGYVNS
jgi:hypothetical protein